MVSLASDNAVVPKASTCRLLDGAGEDRVLEHKLLALDLRVRGH